MLILDDFSDNYLKIIQMNKAIILERVIPDSNDTQFIHHVVRYNFAEKFVAGKLVLDNGCGTGYGAHLLSMSALSVTGVDISEDAINFALENYNRQNLTFKQMDSTSLQFDNEAFDIAVSFEIVEHLSPYDCNKYLNEMKRVVKKDGLILISTPNHDTARLHLKSVDIPICPHHINNMGIRVFKKMVKSHFDSFQIYGQQLKGSLFYTVLRSLDILNLRLRLFSPSSREFFYKAMEIKKESQLKIEDYIIRSYMIRQCQTLIAICKRK